MDEPQACGEFAMLCITPHESNPPPGRYYHKERLTPARIVMRITVSTADGVAASLDVADTELVGTPLCVLKSRVLARAR